MKIGVQLALVAAPSNLGHPANYLLEMDWLIQKAVGISLGNQAGPLRFLMDLNHPVRQQPVVLVCKEDDLSGTYTIFIQGTDIKDVTVLDKGPHGATPGAKSDRQAG